jgi:PEP-CTERM motif
MTNGLHRRHPLKSKLLLAAAALLLQNSAAWAAPYKVVASGTIVELEEHGLAFDSSIVVGTPFSVELSFDSDAPDSDPGDPELGLFLFATPPYWVHVEVGNYILDAGSSGFEIGLSTSAIGVQVRDPVTSGVAPPGSSFLTVVPFNLSDETAEIVNTDALDPQYFDLALWDYSQFGFWSFEGTDSVFAWGELDSLTLTAIPEPSTGALLLGGLMALARRRRR